MRSSSDPLTLRLAVRALIVAASLSLLALSGTLPDRSDAGSTPPSTDTGYHRSEPNPFRGARLYVDPNSAPHRQADAWRSTRPADAAEMDRLAAQPQAAWFGDWNDDVRADVRAEVRAAIRAHAVPVLVAYDIPHRDCSSYSAGGARSARVYRRWIRDFAAGLGAAPAAVVLEPDALPGLDCLAPAERRRRLRLLSDAVKTLSAKPKVAVYLDAGNSGWQPASVIASRLSRAGVARARGFSLNVSNFHTSRSQVAYGARISAKTVGKPFVIDTSRNGAGPTPDRQWCNPSGRALGRRPTVRTGNPVVDAYLWIKIPGESDGECNGGPAAGEWWPEYALGLARRAVW